MIYTTFVTKNTEYEQVVEKHFIASCKKFNLTYDVEYLKNRGSWAQNILYKSEFLKKMLLKHKQNIVSLDADADILKYPSLFEELKDYDIGVHYLDSNLQWHRKTSERREVLGGTIYLRYNEKIMKFLDKWIKITKTDSNFPQKILQRLLEQNTYNLNIYQLPYSYATIITFKNTIPDHIIRKEDVVILHNQVSRQFKNRRK